MDNIAAAISSISNSLVIVQGPAGVGKTTAILEALAQLREVGSRTASVSLSNPARDVAESGSPFVAAIAQIIDAEFSRKGPGEREVLNRRIEVFCNSVAVGSGTVALVFPPAAVLSSLAFVPRIKKAYDSRHSLDSPKDPMHALRELIAADENAVLHFGGAQWLSVGSRSTVSSIAEDLAPSVKVVLEVRSSHGAADLLAAENLSFLRILAEKTPTTWIDVGEFTIEETRDLVYQRFPRNDFPPFFLQTLFNATSGNPFAITVLFDRLKDLGGVPEIDGVWRLNELQVAKAIKFTDPGDPVTSLLLNSWETLTQRERVITSILAMAGQPLSLENLYRVSSRIHAEGVSMTDWRALVDRGVLVEDADRLRLQHDLWSAVIERSLQNLEKSVIHRELAMCYSEGTSQRAAHLLKAGDINGAEQESEFAIELAAEVGDWAEVSKGLDVRRQISTPFSKDLLELDIDLLRRQGRTLEALERIDSLEGSETSLELRSDLVHLAGHYQQAAQMLLDAVADGVQKSDLEAWRWTLRAVHHLKFVDPLRAIEVFDSFLKKGAPPAPVELLAKYTKWGSLMTLVNESVDIDAELMSCIRRAQKSNDIDTLAKASRKLGEVLAFYRGRPDEALEIWRIAMGDLGEGFSRQMLYLEAVAFWLEENSSIARTQDFYIGRKEYFTKLGIPGWVGHCNLLLAEKLRLSGDFEGSIYFAQQGRTMYEDLGMLWGQHAATLSLALSGEGSLHDARTAAGKAQFVPLAVSGNDVQPIALVLP